MKYITTFTCKMKKDLILMNLITNQTSISADLFVDHAFLNKQVVQQLLLFKKQTFLKHKTKQN